MNAQKYKKSRKEYTEKKEKSNFTHKLNELMN